MTRSAKPVTLLLCAIAALVPVGPAAAQEVAGAAGASHLSIELNSVEQQDGTCRLTFVAENRLGSDASAVVLETVLFDTSNQVVDLTLFDFRELPDGSPRVRQFDMAGLDCASLGRVLLNGVHACTGTGLTAELCAAGLRWSSRTRVEVLG